MERHKVQNLYEINEVKIELVRKTTYDGFENLGMVVSCSSGGWRRNRFRRAKPLATLAAKFSPELISRGAKDCLPVEIAVHGKPAMAVYFYSVYCEDSNIIADKMRVERGTVHQYVRRFVNSVEGEYEPTSFK
ncbi:hypothetical protein [Halorientalis sp. IM1011]|uniref:hypothetical protein n=1 Tax=Halorientalis sp. IM1011 TaxID=1932360 RepID=UPI0012FCF252|nr:hypothetical protein [Halorientalis sp. IM1011]